MAKFPYLPLWTDAWVADTKHLSRLERGTYHDLLVLMWRTPGCSVPNDDEWLAKRLGMTVAEVTLEVRPLLAEFCQSDGNRIFQKRLAHEFKRVASTGRKQSVRAKSRWNKDKALCPGNAAPAMPLDPYPERKKRESPENVERGSGGEDLFGPSEPPAPVPKGKRAKGKTPLPDDWQPKGEQRDPTEADEFRNHARAKGYRYVDWDAAYVNFQKSQYNARNNGGGNGHGRRHGSVLDVIDDVIEHTGGYQTNYVPGSSGPRPLELDKPKSTPGLRLIPKG